MTDLVVAAPQGAPYLFRIVDAVPGAVYLCAAPDVLRDQADGDAAHWTDTEARAEIIVSRGGRAAIRALAGGTFDIRKIVASTAPMREAATPARWRLWIEADGSADAWEIPQGETVKIAEGWARTMHTRCMEHRGRRWTVAVIEHRVGKALRWSCRVHHGDIHDPPHLSNIVQQATCYIECSEPIEGSAADVTVRDGSLFGVLLVHPTSGPWHRSATAIARGSDLDRNCDGLAFGLVTAEQLPCRQWPAPATSGVGDGFPLPIVNQFGARPLAQPPWSGTTGDQPGFGAATCGALWDARANPRELRQWFEAADVALRRPTLHTDAGHVVLNGFEHLEVMDLKPHYSSTEQLGGGQDPDGQWMRLPTPSDDQHRDDAALCIMAIATGDELLHERIEAHAWLQSHDVWLHRNWQPTARGMGRVLLALAFAHAAGCARATHLILSYEDLLDTYAGDAVAPWAPTDEAKYGWRTEPDGLPVMGWQPWQQAILAIGILAIPRRAPTVQRLLVDVCSVVVRLGFRRDSEDQPFRHVYAIADSADGVAGTMQRTIPDTLDGEAGLRWMHVQTPECERWSLAACMILCRQTGPIGERARQILAQYPPRSGTSDGQWLAVEPLPAGVLS